MTTAVAHEVAEDRSSGALARRRWLRRGLITLPGLLLVSGAIAWAVVYDRSEGNRLLPGVIVAGRPVGGERATDVVRAVDTRLGALRDRTVRLNAGPVARTTTLAELGVRSDARAAVDRARADANSMGLLRRVWHRALHQPVRASYPVRFHVSRRQVDTVVVGLARRVDRAPVDARLETSTGFVKVIPALEGRTLDQAGSVRAAMSLGDAEANRRAAAIEPSLGLPLRLTPAHVTGYPHVLLVRLGENRLYHYVNGNPAKVYRVATGQPRYPTPQGRLRVVSKRRNPIWINPDPTGWGHSMPARIGPGPGNPLGTRALDLSASGIRIHGTSNTGSLGFSVSHGCIRMSIHDSEELFDQVQTGTPVVILNAAAPRVQVSAPTNIIDSANTPVDLEAGR